MNKETFDRWVDKSGECWIWKGTKSGKYGAGFHNGKTEFAHRISFQLHKGEIPNRMCVCHSCDNPICVNPDHLWIGTHKDNMQDALKKGRMVFGKGCAHQRGAMSRTSETILELFRSGMRRVEIAARLNITKGAVTHCIKRHA